MYNTPVQLKFAWGFSKFNYILQFCKSFTYYEKNVVHRKDIFQSLFSKYFHSESSNQIKPKNIILWLYNTPVHNNGIIKKYPRMIDNTLKFTAATPSALKTEQKSQTNIPLFMEAISTIFYFTTPNHNFWVLSGLAMELWTWDLEVSTNQWKLNYIALGRQAVSFDSPTMHLWHSSEAVP